jgi:hypothetical protein
MKEKIVCGDLFQLADFVRLATPLARFGKVDRTATNQKAGSSNPPGRTTSRENKQRRFESYSEMGVSGRVFMQCCRK